MLFIVHRFFLVPLVLEGVGFVRGVIVILSHDRPFSRVYLGLRQVISNGGGVEASLKHI